MVKLNFKYLGKELRKKLAGITGKKVVDNLVPEMPTDPASRIQIRKEFPSYVEQQIMNLDKIEAEKRRHYEMYDFLMSRRN